MGLSDFFASRLSRPASRVLDAPIRDTIHEILREAGYASPAEVQALRDDVRDLRTRLDGIDRRSGDLARMLEEARAEAAAARGEAQAAAARASEARSAAGDAAARAANAASSAAPTPDPRVAALEDKVARLTGELDALRRAAAAAPSAPAPSAAPSAAPAAPSAPAAAAPAVSAEPRGGCKVAGCDEAVRSKGFCSAHYQQWRRGTLRGFVSLDGTAQVEGRNLVLPPDLAGGAVSVKDGRVFVDGKAVQEIAAG